MMRKNSIWKVFGNKSLFQVGCHYTWFLLFHIKHESSHTLHTEMMWFLFISESFVLCNRISTHTNSSTYQLVICKGFAMKVRETFCFIQWDHMRGRFFCIRRSFNLINADILFNPVDHSLIFFDYRSCILAFQCTNMTAHLKVCW